MIDPAFRGPLFAMSMITLTVGLQLLWTDGWLWTLALVMTLICALATLTGLLNGVRPTDN